MKKNKIAKLTLNGYFNYGNILQNYALQEILLRYADEVDTIWHTSDNFMPRTWWKWSWKELIKMLLDWKGFRKDILSGHIGKEMARQARMRDFCDRYIHYRYDVKDLKSLNDEYDYFVVGSDQVWNPNWEFQKFFLSFASPEKRISYAASISSPIVPEKALMQFKAGIMGMNTLSLREKSGADLVKKLTEREAVVHLDPTMLLTADEWHTVARQPSWYKGEEYILTYFLGKRPAAISQIALETGLSVVNLLDDNIYEHYVTSVDEFVWAIEHASLVYTDSFHGTVFSILFHRPFVACNRIGNEIEENMGSRIDTLLDCFGLEERRGTSINGYRIKDPLIAPDWGKYVQVIQAERLRAEEYLKKVLD